MANYIEQRTAHLTPCAACGIGKRHKQPSGRTIAYCLDCRRERDSKRNPKKSAFTLPKICSMCRINERRKTANGYGSHCPDCHRANQRSLYQKRISSTAPVTPRPCVRCKDRPRHTNGAHEQRYCLPCMSEVARENKKRVERAPKKGAQEKTKKTKVRMTKQLRAVFDDALARAKERAEQKMR